MYINYACRQLVDFLSLEGWGEEEKIRSTDTIEVLGPTELLKIKRKEGQTDLTKRILIEKSTSDIKNHKNLQNCQNFIVNGPLTMGWNLDQFYFRWLKIHHCRDRDFASR